MDEINDSQEIETDLSTLPNILDTKIQGLENRNEIFRTSSNKYLNISNVLKSRMGDLQQYVPKLESKGKKINSEIKIFNKKNEDLNLTLNQEKLSLEKNLESLDSKIIEILNKIEQNKKIKETLIKKISLFESEEETLDSKFAQYKEILNLPPLPPNRNDEAIKSIETIKKSIKQIDEKISNQRQKIDKIQIDIQTLQPINDIAQTLNRAYIRNSEIEEEEYLTSKRIEIENTISREKEESLRNVFAKIKENADKMKAFKSNLVEIKAVNIEIKKEKEKEIKMQPSLLPIEDELRRIGQEFDVEIKKEIQLAKELNKLDELERNRDPELILIEKKVGELNEELSLLMQKKDDMVLVENNLDEKIDKFDQNTLLIKEKALKELGEAAVYHEQKLFKELKNVSGMNENMSISINDLIMKNNVLEAEIKRILKKLDCLNNKIAKYNEIKTRKIKVKNNKKKLVYLNMLLESIQFKIDQQICVNDHKKEDVQTKKSAVEQMIMKFYPSDKMSFPKNCILDSIVPILCKRKEVAKIISKTAFYVKNMFVFQKNLWENIDEKEIESSFERWDDMIEKSQPLIEKKILDALVELVC